MKIVLCILLGYLLGTLSPSALVSKIKKKNLREHGTKNLGATNTLLNFGKGWGAFVLIFDIAKAYIAYKLAQHLFPQIWLAGMIAGCASIVGHIFPFYMGFKGGKGLAALGGAILAHDPLIFLFMVVVCFGLMLLLNYSFVLPISAAILFPILSGIRSGSIAIGLMATLMGGLLLFSHRADIVKVIRGEATHTNVRKFLHRSSNDK